MKYPSFACLALALAIIPSSAAFAQESAEQAGAIQAPIARRLMVDIEAPSESEAQGLRESLDAALAASPLVSIVLDYSGEPEGFADAAAMASCPIALSVRAKAASGTTDLSWRYFSPAAASGELRSGSFEKARPNVRDLAISFWTELVQDLGPAIEALPLDSFTLIAPPGSKIEGFGEAFAMPAEGEAQVEMALPAFVRWKATSSSRLNAAGSVLVEAPGSRVELSLKPVPAWTGELSLYGFSFLEARAAMLLGKRFFVRATLTQYLAGFSLQNDNGSNTDPSIVSSFSLLQAGAGFGAYFEDPEKILRFYAAADAFVRLSLPSAKSIVVDPEMPFGAFPLLGAAWGLETRTKAYLELGGVFYPAADVAYVEAIRKNRGGSMIATGYWGRSSAGWALEFPVPRLGLRLYF